MSIQTEFSLVETQLQLRDCRAALSQAYQAMTNARDAFDAEDFDECRECLVAVIGERDL